jgi:hypothetical protein
MGRLETVRAKATDFSQTDIVSQNEDDVGPA